MLLVLFRCCKSVDSRQITHAGLLPLLICDARFADTATLTAVQKPHGTSSSKFISSLAEVKSMPSEVLCESNLNWLYASI
jgi:hypothetical protein